MDASVTYVLGFAPRWPASPSTNRAAAADSAMSDHQWWERAAPLLAQVFDAARYRWAPASGRSRARLTIRLQCRPRLRIVSPEYSTGWLSSSKTAECQPVSRSPSDIPYLNSHANPDAGIKQACGCCALDPVALECGRAVIVER